MFVQGSGRQGVENNGLSLVFEGFGEVGGRKYWFFTGLSRFWAQEVKISGFHWSFLVLGRWGVENVGFSLVFQGSGRPGVENTCFSFVF